MLPQQIDFPTHRNPSNGRPNLHSLFHSQTFHGNLPGKRFQDADCFGDWIWRSPANTGCANKKPNPHLCVGEKGGKMWKLSGRRQATVLSPKQIHSSFSQVSGQSEQIFSDGIGPAFLACSFANAYTAWRNGAYWSFSSLMYSSCGSVCNLAKNLPWRCHSYFATNALDTQVCCTAVPPKRTVLWGQDRP